MTAPLLVTGDETLLDELLRLAAAAGVHARRWPATAAAALRALGARAPLVLVGADLAAEVARLRPARRPGVHVVGLGRRARRRCSARAVALGAESVAELPDAPAAGWSSCSPTSATRRRAGLTRRGGRRLRRRRRDDVRLRPGPGGRPAGPGRGRRRRPARARASTGSSGSRTATASGGTRCARPPAGSARASLREALPRRDGARRADLVRRAAGPPCRPSRCARRSPRPQRGHDTVVVDLPRARRPAGRGGGGALRPAARGGRGRPWRGRGLGGPAVRAARAIRAGSGWWCGAAASAPTRSPGHRGAGGGARWPTSAGSTRRSTSGSGRCAPAAGRSAGPPDERAGSAGAAGPAA